MSVELRSAIPVLRIFSEEKMREFCLGFLGFALDWDHRFARDFPVHLQVSRGPLRLQLTEHYGGPSPGGQVFVEMRGTGELPAKSYRYMRPGIEDAPWDARTPTVIDHFATGSSSTSPIRPEGGCFVLFGRHLCETGHSCMMPR